MTLALAALCLPALAAAGAPEPQPGLLDLRESFDPSRGIPIEGAISYVRVTRAGAVVLHEENRKRSFRRRLPPGVYRLVSYWRVCNGTCERLSPPGDRCRVSVRVLPESRTVVRVRRNAEGCTATAGRPR